MEQTDQLFAQLASADRAERAPAYDELTALIDVVPGRAEVWGTVLSCLVRRCEDAGTRVEWAAQLVDMASHTIRPRLVEELEDARRAQRGESPLR